MGEGVLTPLLEDAGLDHDAGGTIQMGGVSLREIAEAVGTPTFVYDAGTIRRRYAELDEAFGQLPHSICYAVKANSNLAILKLFADLGAGADIVSGGEMLRAIAAGFSPDRIVFSGVGKTDEELQAAIAAGIGHVNVESLAELRRLVLLAELQGSTLAIGVRINPDVTADTHPYISTGQGGLKFGISIDQFDEVLAILDETAALTLDSLAMHIGSQILDPQPWVDALDRLLGILERARGRGHSPSTLDIGGGMGIRYCDEQPLSPKQLLDALRSRLAASGCQIQMEPGRSLVGSAGIMLTRVVHRKHSGGHDIAVVDAGMNDLLRPALYSAHHEIVPIDAHSGPAVPTDIVGPICETGDFLALGRDLPPVPAGGVLAVLGAGAYGFAMASNYNSRARAAEVMVDDGRWGVARPRERLVDLFRDERLDPFNHEQT